VPKGEDVESIFGELSEEVDSRLNEVVDETLKGLQPKKGKSK
jgi:hypothetical protein